MQGFTSDPFANEIEIAKLSSPPGVSRAISGPLAVSLSWPRHQRKAPAGRPRGRAIGGRDTDVTLGSRVSTRHRFRKFRRPELHAPRSKRHGLDRAKGRSGGRCTAACPEEPQSLTAPCRPVVPLAPSERRARRGQRTGAAVQVISPTDQPGATGRRLPRRPRRASALRTGSRCGAALPRSDLSVRVSYARLSSRSRQVNRRLTRCSSAAAPRARLRSMVCGSANGHLASMPAFCGEAGTNSLHSPGGWRDLLCRQPTGPRKGGRPRPGQAGAAQGRGELGRSGTWRELLRGEDMKIGAGEAAQICSRTVRTHRAPAARRRGGAPSCTRGTEEGPAPPTGPSLTRSRGAVGRT